MYAPPGPAPTPGPLVPLDNAPPGTGARRGGGVRRAGRRLLAIDKLGISDKDDIMDRLLLHLHAAGAAAVRSQMVNPTPGKPPALKAEHLRIFLVDLLDKADALPAQQPHVPACAKCQGHPAKFCAPCAGGLGAQGHGQHVHALQQEILRLRGQVQQFLQAGAQPAQQPPPPVTAQKKRKSVDFDSRLVQADRKVVMRNLGLSGEAKPKNLTADQWIFVQNMTIAYTQFKSSSELSGDGVHSDELDVAMAWWARKIGCGQSDCKQSECGSLWKCVVVDVMRDLGEAIGTPWKWLMHCDSRMKMSLLDIQAFHDISVALSRQWFEGKLNIKIPRSLLGNWLVPHKGQMQEVVRESNLVVHRLLHPVYVAPLLGPDDAKTTQVRDIDYAAINDVQNAVEIEIHDSGLDGYGTVPEDAVEMKITGDGGNCSRKQSIVFNALQNVDRRRRMAITGYSNGALQSTDDLIPLVAIVGKETGALWHSYFKPSFAFKKMVEANKGCFYHRGLNRNFYINVRGCTDQSTMHKISGTCKRNDKGIKVVKSRGGAISTCGCHMCNVNGKFAHQPKTGNKRCDRCQSYDGTKDQIDYCYCHEILVKDVVARIERDVKTKLESLPNKCVPAFVFLQVLGMDSLNSGQLLELNIPDDTSRRDTSRQLESMLKNDFISALDKDKKLPQHINKPPGTTIPAVSKRTQNIRKCLEIFGVESTDVYSVIKTRLKNLLDT